MGEWLPSMYEGGEKQKREKKKEGKRKEGRRTGKILAGRYTDLSGYDRGIEI